MCVWYMLLKINFIWYILIKISPLPGPPLSSPLPSHPASRPFFLLSGNKHANQKNQDKLLQNKKPQRKTRETQNIKNRKSESKRSIRQKLPKQSNVNQNTTDFFCVGHLLLGMGPTLKCGLYTQRDSIWKKKNEFFLCKQLSIRDSFWVGGGSLYPFPPS